MEWVSHICRTPAAACGSACPGCSRAHLKEASQLSFWRNAGTTEGGSCSRALGVDCVSVVIMAIGGRDWQGGRPERTLNGSCFCSLVTPPMPHLWSLPTPSQFGATEFLWGRPGLAPLVSPSIISGITDSSPSFSPPVHCGGTTCGAIHHLLEPTAT